MVDDKLAPLMRSAGMVLSPFNAWVVLKGWRPAIRMEAQSANALALAQWLEQQPQVARVYYPGLPSHPQHALAMRQQSTHPASTSHGRLTEAQRQAAGIGQGLIRVAVGLEHIDDLKADLARGLDTLS
jgi:O-succinylhomoserine sulfhydrylase